MYIENRQNIESEARRLKAKKLKIRRILRATWVFSLIGLSLGLIIFGLVTGIKAIINGVRGSKEHKESVMATVELSDGTTTTLAEGITSASDTTAETALAEGVTSASDSTATTALAESIASASDTTTATTLAASTISKSDSTTATKAKPRVTQNNSINGIPVFGGYEVITTSDTYEILSENVQSAYGILIDASTGEVICQRQGFTRINPASMTKILTILVAAEHIKPEDMSRKIKITSDETDYAYQNDLSTANFEIDEEVTIEDLFYGTILPSGADAAMALAKFVAGDIDSFVDMMNDKISELGFKNTHFTNCVGSFGQEHYSTCADMGMILKAALENDYCYRVLNAHKYNTTPTPQHPEGIELSNWFLRRIEDKDTYGEVLCAKTGYVNQSGSCAASFSLQKDAKPYICVTAQAHSAWRCIYDQVDIYYNCTGNG